VGWKKKKTRLKKLADFIEEIGHDFLALQHGLEIRDNLTLSIRSSNLFRVNGFLKKILSLYFFGCLAMRSVVNSGLRKQEG
jgi:hypothetical protein